MYRPDLLAEKIIDFIIPNYNKYYDMGFVIELVYDSILVNYKNKTYTVNVLEQSNNDLVWEIKNDDTYIVSNFETSFDDIINTILEKNN